nr:MAG TPA: helix-turn-helix domain protein [Caudoviricetes sp.]
MDKGTFTARLQQLRRQTKRSACVTSELIGLSPSAYRRYEAGERMPTIEAVVLIADYFDVSADYLLGLTDDAQRR